MKIVDSSVWIDHINGRLLPHVQALRRLGPEGDIGLCDLILMEVLQGLRSRRLYDETLESLLTLPVFPLCGVDLVVKSAQNYRFLRSRGFTVRKPIDCLIATFCIENGYGLLHSDRDYLPFEEHLGLKSVAV